MSTRPPPTSTAESDEAASRLQSVLRVGHSFQSAQQVRPTTAAPGDGGGALVGPGGNGLARAEVTTPNVQYDDGRMQGGLWGGRADEAKPRRPWETVAAEKEARFVSSMKHLGGKYSGQVKDGVPSGFGTLKWTEGGKEREYKGVWRDGTSNGDGTLTSTSPGFTMKAEGAFGKNFQPVDANVDYRHGSEKLELSSVTATPYLYGSMTGEKGTWYRATFNGYKDADSGMKLHGVRDDGVSAAHIEWSGKSLDDFATSLMNEESNAVLSGRVAFRPPSHILKEEGLDDSMFLGSMEIKNGKARWRSEVRRHVGAKTKFSSETTIGDAAETWKADAFDLEGMNDQRTQEEVQRKIDLFEKRARDEESAIFWGRALRTLGIVMMAVVGRGAYVSNEEGKRVERERERVAVERERMKAERDAKKREDERVKRASKELYNASENGDLVNVQRLLAVGADPNFSNGFSSVLRKASELGYVEIVKALVAAGADIDKTDFHFGKPPLTVAIENGRFDVVKALIAAGADVNAGKSKDLPENTPLSAASERGSLDVVKALLAAGADPGRGDYRNAVDDFGRMHLPLAMAGFAGHLAVVKVLLAAGANVNAGNGIALRHACSSRNAVLAVVEALISAGADVNLHGWNNAEQPALYWAIENGNVGIVKALLAAGANVNVSDPVSRTPLQKAKTYRRDEIAELLRRYGATR